MNFYGSGYEWSPERFPGMSKSDFTVVVPMFERLRTWARDLAGIDDPPHKIALGMALGIFVGFLPIMGIQMAVVLPFALLFRGNKFAAMAGVWVSNPITVLPIYYMIYVVGVAFTPYAHLTWANFTGVFAGITATKFLDLGGQVVVPLFVGGAITGIIAGIPTYFVTRRMVITSRKQLEKRRERKAASTPGDDTSATD